MKIHNYPGFFIDIEGLDGSGVSTQAQRVARALTKEGIKSYATKEPSDGPVGELIRQILKKELRPLPPSSIQMLFAADRGGHLKQKIIPRLEKGKAVITDRYAWSSVAFGSINLNREWLLNLNKHFILPDLTIFIEVAPDTCLARIAKERDGIELFEEEEKLQQAWGTYHFLVSKYWWTYMAVVNGEQKPEKVTEEILDHIKRHPKFGKIKKKK